MLLLRKSFLKESLGALLQVSFVTERQKNNKDKQLPDDL